MNSFPSPYLNMLRERLMVKLWRLYLDAVSATDGESLMGSSVRPEAILHSVADELEEDLLHFASVDPAAHGDARIILDSYSSFVCVLHYRLAHALLSFPDRTDLRQRAARWLADQGKVISGADIHPAARIGRRVVLDHAVGTVVGETAEVGDDCYMLGGVILGARGISANSIGKRHPTIGDNVQIGGFARILGPVTVGDHVFIAPHSVITLDVPSNTQVNVMSQLQIGRPNGTKAEAQMRIVGAGVIGKKIMVLGNGFGAPSVEMLDEHFLPCQSVIVETALEAPHVLGIEVIGVVPGPAPQCLPHHVKISDHGEEIIVMAPQGLAALVERKRIALFAFHHVECE
ncbi:serine O-acetyltransferase [Pseudothauera rhizosphaerae]|uniref:serine O-acetyltransferase n=1 Tax=Pseudothauera rhizosphaerae TaxID=2565932 RepID=A0A4S4AVE7_9RHOO|nr:serine O-acetyltransferase [Pseudothauera rhizosphaerae]THF63520.1 serine acetyltransferase [Pseudothauera rhizosphaerae]